MSALQVSHAQLSISIDKYMKLDGIRTDGSTNRRNVNVVPTLVIQSALQVVNPFESVDLMIII